MEPTTAQAERGGEGPWDEADGGWAELPAEATTVSAHAPGVHSPPPQSPLQVMRTPDSQAFTGTKNGGIFIDSIFQSFNTSHWLRYFAKIWCLFLGFFW